MKKGMIGEYAGLTKGVVEPYSSVMNSHKADLIVASVDKNVIVMKDTHYDVKKQKVLDAICRLISHHVFGKKYKLFVPAFEEAVKGAIEGVIEEHHLKGVQNEAAKTKTCFSTKR